MSATDPALVTNGSAQPTVDPVVQSVQLFQTSSTTGVDKNTSTAPLANNDVNSAARHLSNGDVEGVGSNSDEGKHKKRRNRRGKRRRWKPYHKLSTEEKLQLELREQKRAEKMRADRFAHGQPMAPYNTTQFLLQDREARNQETKVEALIESLQNPMDGPAGVVERERTDSGSYVGSETSEAGSWHSGDGPAGSDSDFEREFEFEYESIHAERLETMSKVDLIRDYLLLEHQLEKAQGESEELRIAVVKLKQENHSLRQGRTFPVDPSPSKPVTDDSGLAMKLDDDMAMGYNSV